MLIEAAGRLFGTLDLDVVLPDVLELAQSTLAVDAYSLWRRDPERNTWALQASRGPLSRVRRRGARSHPGQRKCRRPRRADRPERHPFGDVADARAQGGARCGGNSRDDRGAAAPPGRRDRDARLLLARPANVRRGRAARGERGCEPGCGCDRDGVRLPEAGAASPRDATTARRGERRPRVVARLRDDARERRGPRRSSRSPTGASSTSSARTARSSGSPSRTRIPAKVERAQAADREAADRPDAPQGVPAVIRTQQPRGTAGLSTTRCLRSASATGPTCSRSCASSGSAAAMTSRSSRAASRSARSRFVAAESGRPTTRPISRSRSTSRAARRVAVDNARALPRGAPEGEPGALPRRGRQRAQRVARLRRDARGARAAGRAARSPTGASSTSSTAAEIRRVAVAAADDERQRALEELRANYPPTWDSPQPAARALREGGAGHLRGVRRRAARRHGRRRRGTSRSWRSSIRTPPSRCRSSRAARRSVRSPLPGRRRGRATAERDLPLMDDLALAGGARRRQRAPVRARARDRATSSRSSPR